MVVHTQDKHPGHSGAIGLHIGEANAREHFPQHLATVEFELDHLRICCALDPSFWNGQPEIHDDRLSSWLKSKCDSGKLASQAAPVALIPCGAASFRLQLLARDETDRALTGPPRAAYFAPSIPVTALVNRRRHNSRQKPDRRKVVRIKGDERPSPAASH